MTPGPAASADIQVNDGDVYQTIFGFGASLSESTITGDVRVFPYAFLADASAQLLSNLKVSCVVTVLSNIVSLI